MIQQLSVFLQNEPGKLAAITTALAEGGIDLRALSIADTTDFGILRMLVSDAAKARAILEQKRYSASVTAVKRSFQSQLHGVAPPAVNADKIETDSGVCPYTPSPR